MKKNLCILLMLFSTSAMAESPASVQLGELINQRLSFMQDVAADKAVNHKPVEDLQQESRVLANSVSRAGELGLDAESVKPFIQAQMDAAKAIQYRYRADWLAQPVTRAGRPSLTEVRETIGKLSESVLQQTATLLKAGETPRRDLFLKQLQQTHLSEADKQHIWSALEKVRLAKP